jgi:hypothetical protein
MTKNTHVLVRVTYDYHRFHENIIVSSNVDICISTFEKISNNDYLYYYTNSDNDDKCKELDKNKDSHYWIQSFVNSQFFNIGDIVTYQPGPSGNQRQSYITGIVTQTMPDHNTAMILVLKAFDHNCIRINKGLIFGPISMDSLSTKKDPIQEHEFELFCYKDLKTFIKNNQYRFDDTPHGVIKKLSQKANDLDVIISI